MWPPRAALAGMRLSGTMMCTGTARVPTETGYRTATGDDGVYSEEYSVLWSYGELGEAIHSVHDVERS